MSIIIASVITALLVAQQSLAQSFVFSKTLYRGLFEEDVRQLQEFLKNPPSANFGGGVQDIYPEGLVTGYFGPLTEKAVKRFQAKYGIEQVGIVGPKTRAKLNELRASAPLSKSVSKSERKPNPALCPDNIWDEAEQKELNLCPADNPANNPKSVAAKISLQPSQTLPQASSSPPASSTTTPPFQPPPSPQPAASSSDWQYLAFTEKLPSLPIIETWKFEYDVSSGGAFVPDIIEYNGKLIMYAYFPLTGIVSFSSSDGKTWIKDAGVRVAEESKYSHPYAVIAPDGKLYLFLQTGKPGTFNMYVSLSESSDGLNFSAPQSILKGEDFGSNHAAHGRIIKLNDGKYLLAVSSSVGGRGPGGSALLYSSDLKTWSFGSTFFAGCHDPTFDAIADGGVRLYCQFQGDKIIRFDSTDGYKWEPQNPAGIVEFVDQNGTTLGMASYASADDIDAHTFRDRTKRIFISVHTPPGTPNVKIWSMVKTSD